MNSQSKAPTLLLLGGPKTGKTHYSGQLLRRLQARQGQLHMVGVPSDMSGLQEVLDALAQGKSAPHTPVNVYRESVWRVCHVTDGTEADLIWPDYGGEQVERLISQRQVPQDWVERIRLADGWLLFIRLSLLPQLDDMLTRPRALNRMQRLLESVPDTSAEEQVGGEKIPAPNVDSPLKISPLDIPAQERFIELLQTLLFVKHADTSRRIKQPPLFVVLSCWDELLPESEQDRKEYPSELLKSRLPLFYQFIHANWASDALQILGLSAQGKPLDDKKPDEDFVDNGPERQGYCVLPDGTRSPDLTLPLARLMQEALLS